MTRAIDRHVVVEARHLDLTTLNDVFLTFHYRGDRALAMLNGALVTDHLYASAPWQIGLKRYAALLQEHALYVTFFSMRKEAPYLGALEPAVRPDFATTEEYLDLHRLEILPEYKVRVALP
ncbi:MAG: hypothetical protein AB7N91_20625 [Candidatus Tectimicrobiota bacterium]